MTVLSGSITPQMGGSIRVPIDIASPCVFAVENDKLSHDILIPSLCDA